ncbi:MAG: class I SAM-dependent methyltransferase [Chloroflexota bacterium]
MTATKSKPGLTAVPETMLWTLHNRAPEAMRPDGIIKDPEAVRIYESIDYDYKRSFGRSNPTHAVRSLTFDKEVQAFLNKHPNGVIVNLGEGLETQRFRVKGDQALWISVDLPESIEVRERFIQPDENHRHVPLSATDTAWFDEVPADRPLFVTAQGLFMYFTGSAVRDLLQQMSERFPSAYVMFDVIPVWFSNRTMSGFSLTSHYTAPKMPWGVNRSDIEVTLRSFVPSLAEVKDISFGNYPRGAPRILLGIANRLPFIRNVSPSIALIQFAN